MASLQKTGTEIRLRDLPSVPVPGWDWESVGFRTELAENVMGDAIAERGGLRELVGTKEIQDYWLNAFVSRLKAGKRDAVRLYAELRGELGSKLQFAQLVVLNIGTDVETARKAVAAMQMANGDKATLIAQCEEYLTREYEADPKASWRSPLRRVLLNATEVPSGT